MEYLKNVVLKYMTATTEDQERLIPVIATLLRMSVDERKDIDDKRRIAQTPLVSRVFGLFSGATTPSAERRRLNFDEQ